ncbi:MAG: DUF2029 domain-containing protein [Paludibacteraceae bacterium]|nr:DUF2029 domain-containing protein [Paludibacteraceae bacterium]
MTIQNPYRPSADILLAGIIGCIGAVIWGFQLHGTLVSSPVYCDSGYYLAIAQQLAEGHSLYSEIRCAYPPLWLYLMAGLLKILPPTGYTGWLVVQALVNLATASLIGLLCHAFTSKRWAAALAGWLCACSTFQFGGDQVLLEIPSLAFGLLSAYLIQRSNGKWHRILLAGVCAAVSFGIKQYGAGFILLNLALLMANDPKNWRQPLIYSAGVLVPLLAVFAINPLVVSIFQSGYGTSDIARQIYRDLGPLRHIPEACRQLFRYFLPGLLALLYPGFYLRGKKQALPLAWCLLGIIGFLGQFYFNNGDHYYLYLLGIGAVAIGCLTAYCIREPWYIGLTVLLLTAYTCRCQYDRYHNWWWYRDGDRARERELTGVVKRITPEESTLYVFNAENIGQYYLCQRRPPVIDGCLSYSFGPLALNNDLVAQRIRQTDYLLKRKDLEWEFKVCDSIRLLLSRCDTLYADDKNVLLKADF